MRKWVCMLVVAVYAALPPVAAQAGSWQQINQDLGRPDGWRRIVEHSEFEFGGRTSLGQINGQEVFSIAFGDYPNIDGSTVAVPMAMEFARQHAGLSDEDVQGFVFFSTTHGAYENLIHRRPGGLTMIASQFAQMDDAQPVDLVIATEPSDDELALAQEHGVVLVTEPVCYDAFVFIVHKDNPIENLSVAELRSIYSGEVKSWKNFGGLDEEIFAYQREPNSGSQTAMEKMVMEGRPMDGAQPIGIVSEMGELIRCIGAYEDRAHSLGYTYLYYIDTLYKSDDIKVLSIDGVAPTPENIRSGAYPFTTNYYGVIRAGDKNAAGGRFLHWMLSEEGQRCIAQAGYISMTEVR
ncbi:MAG: substrate-binding domain-containing protein [Clostridia bacterium]|nr:substrate-binding domain-containing protein [Clostridia bacterium]